MTKPTRFATGRAKATTARTTESPPLITVFEDMLTALQRRNTAPRTMAHYLHYLGPDEHAKPRNGKVSKWKPLLRWCSTQGVTHLEQLTKPVLERYLEESQRDATPYVYRDINIFLKRFLKYANEEGLLLEIPLRITRPRVAESQIAVFTQEEVDRIAKVVVKEHPRDWAIFMTLVCTGLRSNEVTSLLVDDVRFDRQEIVVRKEVAKSRRERIVPMSEAFKALRAYWLTRADLPKERYPYFFLSFIGSPVFSGGKSRALRRLVVQKVGTTPYSGAPMGRVGLYHLVKKWGTLAGITEARCSPHTFRHFFAVQFLREGGDLLHLKSWLGHSKFEMTEKYARLANTDLHAAARKVSPGARYLQARYVRAVPEK